MSSSGGLAAEARKDEGSKCLVLDLWQYRHLWPLLMPALDGQEDILNLEQASSDRNGPQSVASVARSCEHWMVALHSPRRLVIGHIIWIGDARSSVAHVVHSRAVQRYYELEKQCPARCSRAHPSQQRIAT